MLPYPVWPVDVLPYVESVAVAGDEVGELLVLEGDEYVEPEVESVEEDWLVTTGVVAVVVSVAAVLEDLVLLLQPLRANPARIRVNNIEFFIGGLSCAPTDRARSVRFATHLGAAAHEKIYCRGDRPVAAIRYHQERDE